MQPTNRLRTFTISTLALVALVLTGMRCNSATPGVPAEQPKIPTYTETRVIDRVDWPNSDQIDQAAFKALKPEAAATIASSTVPVLVPNEPKMLSQGVLWVLPHSYGFGTNGMVGGVSITITATGVSTQIAGVAFPPSAYEEDPSAISIRGAKVSITQNDANNWMADWVENGEVSYNVHLVFQDKTDPRYLTSDYLINLVKNLVYVGGNGK